MAERYLSIFLLVLPAHHSTLLRGNTDMYMPPRIGIALGSIALLLGASLPVAQGVSASSPAEVVGHVYVNDNTAGTNTIGAFERHADGTLSPETGSPFVAGGAGTGAGLASQGALQISPDGRFLIAVDAGSNQISVLRIKHDGSVKLVPAGVVSSGGPLPVSVAIHDDLVYVANSGSVGSNYTGFWLDHDGRLQPIAGSTFALPNGSQPGDVLFNGNGTKLVGTRVGTSQIDSFRVGGDGRLTAAPGSPFAAQGLGPFGSEFRPTNPGQLFVSNAHNGTGLGTVSAFSDSANGTLSSIGASPFPDFVTAPCWVEITHRRPVSVHREHRVGPNLSLLDRSWWYIDAARQHASRRHGWCRRSRRAPEPRRWHSVRRREQDRRHRRVRRQRRRPDRAARLPDLAARRRHTSRDSRQLAHPVIQARSRRLA